jgi:hypothetical protein
MAPAAEVYGVSGIVPALISRDTVKVFRKDIDNFSFAFIAPLKPDDCDVLFHSGG